MREMNKYFIKGLMIGTFIGFVLTSPRRDEWAQMLARKIKTLAKRAVLDQRE